MMLPDDSDWFRLCPLPRGCGGGRTSELAPLGVTLQSKKDVPILSVGVVTVGAWASAQPLGEPRVSMHAETGVGAVDVLAAVLADLGVVMVVPPESGV